MGTQFSLIIYSTNKDKTQKIVNQFNMDSYPNGDTNDGQLQIVEAAQQPDSEQILINDFGNPNLQKMVDVVLQAYNHEWGEL